MHFRLLAPRDAPAGSDRAMSVVVNSLLDPSFQTARITVAFARKAGVLRLMEPIQKMRTRGGRVELVVGVDHQGTSLEALELLLEASDRVVILHEPRAAVTFHPKMFFFDGPQSARALVGSHNLTLGGLETNYEAGVLLDFDLPTDNGEWTRFNDAWFDLQPANNPNSADLDQALLARLVARQLVQPERVVQARGRAMAGGGAAGQPPLPFGSITIAAPTAISKATVASPHSQHPTGQATPLASGSVLLIEVVPHQNSEVFLSATAIAQNPGFFNWPWSGMTTPKNASNKPYPKMDPNPKIQVVAYDMTGAVVVARDIEPEIMRYHNADVRMTIGQDLLPVVPAYSLLVIRHPDAGIGPGYDYEIEVHPEGSPGYVQWIAACNQVLPSGGQPRARKMGWI